MLKRSFLAGLHQCLCPLTFASPYKTVSRISFFTKCVQYESAQHLSTRPRRQKSLRLIRTALNLAIHSPLKSRQANQSCHSRLLPSTMIYARAQEPLEGRSAWVWTLESHVFVLWSFGLNCALIQNLLTDSGRPRVQKILLELSVKFALRVVLVRVSGVFINLKFDHFRFHVCLPLLCVSTKFHLFDVFCITIKLNGLFAKNFLSS